MVNTRKDHNYRLLPLTGEHQEDTWESLSLPDDDPPPARRPLSCDSYLMVSLAAIMRQKRYRNLIIMSSCLFIFFLWLSSQPSSPWDSPVTEDEWLRRSEQVKQAFLHAYDDYEKYAWGYDELKPITKGRVNNFNGWGLTIYDSLSTMAIMKLDSHVSRATKHISDQLAMNPSHPFAISPAAENKHVPFFESTIRYLGALLSTYALTNKSELLEAADKLGAAMLPIFETPSGLPRWGIDTITGELVDSRSHEPHKALLAEIASCQMEYKYLAKLTHNQQYFEKVDRIMRILEDRQLPNGLWPTLWNTSTGLGINNHFSVGAWSDSAYEYLLKQYLMSNHTEKRLLELYKSSINGVIDNLVYISPTRHLLYVTDIGYSAPFLRDKEALPRGRFEHLSCFLPGLLALGAANLGDDEASAFEKARWRWAAEGIAWTCATMYRDTPTGIGPEEVTVTYEGTSNASEILRTGRWKELLESWEREGRPTPKPPGVNDLAPPIKHFGRFSRNSRKEERDYVVRHDKYLMRPETIESVYTLYRTTGDPKWRYIGWEMFQALERYARHSVGYSSLTDIDGVPLRLDEMPSYALAETWKYLYLLCLGKERDPLPMDRWVFNTEAHPLPVFDWTDEEKALFHIS